MPVRLDRPWQSLTRENVDRVGAHLGVYQLANSAGDIVYIGVADARSLFGLRGELQRHLDDPANTAASFRVEVTMAYRTRHFELLGVFLHDHGRLPAANTDIERTALGTLRPGGGPA